MSIKFKVNAMSDAFEKQVQYFIDAVQFLILHLAVIWDFFIMCFMLALMYWFDWRFYPESHNSSDSPGYSLANRLEKIKRLSILKNVMSLH